MLMQIDKIGSLHFLAEFVGKARKNQSGAPLTYKYYFHEFLRTSANDTQSANRYNVYPV